MSCMVFNDSYFMAVIKKPPAFADGYKGEECFVFRILFYRQHFVQTMYNAIGCCAILAH